MRSMGMLVALALAGASLAEPPAGLPRGTYTGAADWRGPGGTTGTYTVEKTFDGDRVSALYRWNDTGSREERHAITFARRPGEPVFDVLDEQGQSVGRAHCYDDSCSYRASFGPVTVEESFQWSGDVMTVLGAKAGPGFSVVWKESLKLR
jgi:hypothetical protein